MATSVSPRAVRLAIRDELEHGAKSIEDVAQRLHVSRSTLQRALANRGTNFTELRMQEQAKIALRELTSGASAARAARRALVTPDHLRLIIKQVAGLTPGQIVRATYLSQRVQFLRERDPPGFGSSRYRREMRQWHRIDAELDRLLGDIGPSNPLAHWARRTLVSAVRPDFRRQPYREEIRVRREEEREQINAYLREIGLLDEKFFGEDLEVLGAVR